MGRHSLPSYLIKNDYSFCFRLVIPDDLRQIIGLRELRYSLHTCVLREAKYRSARISVKIQDLFTGLRAMAKNEEIQFDAAKIKAIIKEELESIESARESTIISSGAISEETYRMNKWLFENLLEKRQTELRLGDFTTVRKSIDRIMQELGMWKWYEDADYRKLCLEILRMEVKHFEKLLRENEGDYSDEDEKVVIQPVQIQQQEQPSELLSAVLSKYLAEKSKTVTVKTLEEYNKCVSLMIEIVGDVEIKRVDRQVFRQYKEDLQRLPSNMRKKPRYKDLPIHDILKMDIPEDDLFDFTNVNKYITRASEFFNFAVVNGFCDINPASGMTLKKKDKRDFEQREAFTIDELKKLFCSPDYINDSFRESFMFWVPVIALYSGCRLEEICQLSLEDIRKEDGIWVLDINQKGDKRLKNTTAIRIVPLHPFLVDELGLIKYCDSLKKVEKDRLFPELSRQRDGYSGRVSKWFSRYKRRCGIVVDDKKRDFHSIRHNFINHCKQYLFSVDSSLLKQIVGHSDDSETFGRYGKQYRAKVLHNEIICKIDYGLDLSHLKKSRFVQNGTKT